MAEFGKTIDPRNPENDFSYNPERIPFGGLVPVPSNGELVPREEVISRTPNTEPLNAAKYGALQGVRGMASLVDLLAQGADFISPYSADEGFGFSDPATGLGLTEALDANTQGFVPEGYQPEGALEGLIRAGSEGLTATALAGGGLGVFRAAPKLFRGGIKDYAYGMTDDYARNALGQISANTAAAGASDALQQSGSESVPLQIASGLLAGYGGDSVARMGVRAAQGKGKAAQNAAGKLGTAVREGNLNKLVGNLSRRLQSSVGEGVYTERDVIDARDMIMQVLFGRMERITDMDIDDALKRQGPVVADQLRVQKQIMDEVFGEIAFYAALHDKGVATPSLYGMLRGAGLDNRDLSALARTQSMGQMGRQVEAANVSSAQQTARDALTLRPSSATGDPADIQEATLRIQRDARDVVSEPYQSPKVGDSEVKSILDGVDLDDASGFRLRPLDVQSVVRNTARDMEMTAAEIEAVAPVQKIVDRFLSGDVYDDDGMISLFEYDGLRKALARYARESSTTGAEKPFVGALMKKIDGQIERRLKRADPEGYARYREIRRDYADYQATYGEKLNPGDRARLDRRNLDLESGVAKTLRNIRSSANEETAALSTANELLKLSNAHGHRDVANQVRRVLKNDADAMAEVEAALWNRIYGPVIDPDSTAAQVRKSQRAVEGVSYMEGEGNLLSLYREIAGDDKADAVSDLLRRARASRADTTYKGDENYRAGSMIGAQMNASDMAGVARAAGDAAQGNITSAIGNIVRTAMGKWSSNESEVRIANAIQAVQLNPRVLLELLEAPSAKAYEEWSNRWLAKSARNTGRGVRGTDQSKD